MNKLITAFVVLSTLFFTSCATIMRGSDQLISVDTNVRNANVYIDGVLVGKTPFNGKIKKKNNVEIKVTKKGYDPIIRTFESDIDTVFWVNILTGGSFGSTTDYATDSMWKIDQGTIYFNMKKAQVSLNYEKDTMLKKFTMTNFKSITRELQTNGGPHLNSLHNKFFSSMKKDQFIEDVSKAYKANKSNPIGFGEQIAAWRK